MNRPPHKSPSPSTGPGGQPAVAPKLDFSKLRHELRTPINHILGYCEILQEDEHTPASFQADLRKIHAGGRQLLTLVTEYFDEENFETRRHDLFQLCHELRTPVNHVIGYSEMLEEEAKELGQKRPASDLHKISSAARQWLALMDEYLVTPACSGTESPARSADLLTMGLSFTPPAPAHEGGPEKVSGHVLVVDDDDANRDMLARRLRRQGFRVGVAASGLEGLKALRAERFDLILLDLVMPNLDGFQVLTRMKSDPVLAEVPVIMISALDQVTGIARCIEAGAEDYLSKPFDPMLLRARVVAALAKKRARDAEREQRRQSTLPTVPGDGGSGRGSVPRAGAAGEPSANAAGGELMSAVKSKAVFLSYASQDAEVAMRISEALRAAGIEVWFDRNELVGGDAWDAKIRKQIRECALFVPVISAHTDARLEAYFRREWKLAVDRTHDMAEEKAFLVPVVVDATGEASASVPAKFREVQWTRLLGGEAPAAFCLRMKALLAGAGGQDLRPPST